MSLKLTSQEGKQKTGKTILTWYLMCKWRSILIALFFSGIVKQKGMPSSDLIMMLLHKKLLFAMTVY